MPDKLLSRERYGEAFWRAHHEAWRHSELNQREYCEAQRIPLKPFGNWQAKFKAEPQPPSPKLLYRRGGLSHTLSHSLSPRLSHDLPSANLVCAPNGWMTTSSGSVLKTSTPISRGSKPRFHQRRSRRRDRGPIDQSLPAHLPREDMRLDLEHQACPCCGGELHLIGETVSEMLDHVPARLRVIRICRPRYGCRACGTIHQASALERLIAKGLDAYGILAP